MKNRKKNKSGHPVLSALLFVVIALACNPAATVNQLSSSFYFTANAHSEPAIISPVAEVLHTTADTLNMDLYSISLTKPETI